jgi:uncharacterized NAD-dependent epimerase/dehydratase family protein
MMTKAIVYCEGAFNTPNGKTAHGLVRFTERYQVLCVIDSHYTGKDAREVLDGKKTGIPIVANLKEALQVAAQHGGADTFVVGLAPDGGRLPAPAKEVVREAITQCLNVDSGLHDFLSEDPALVALAKEKGVRIRDIRNPQTEKTFTSLVVKLKKWIA